MVTALLVLRATLAVLALRGDAHPRPESGPEPTDDVQPPDEAEVGFLSGEALSDASSRGPAAAAANTPPPPVRPPRRALWPGWAKVLASAVPFTGVTLGLTALALMVLRATQPDSLPPLLNDASTVLALVLVALSILAVWILWRVPQWQAAAWAEQSNATPRERFEIENASRGTLGQILSGVAVLAGLIFAWQQLGSTTRSVQLSEQGQLTDRFTSAIGQLASADLEVRLGGIYALEQIARDNPRDFAAAMQVLAAVVRGDGEADATELVVPMSRDIEVAMTVIGRRSPEQLGLQADQGIPCLDLRGAQLGGLGLPYGANLRALCLDGADLSQASLDGADFTGSSLLNATLEGARLDRATLPFNLSGADLDGAFLSGVRLDGVNLTGVSLVGALFVCTTDAGEPVCASLRDANLLSANATAAFFDGADLTRTDFSLTQLTNASFLQTDLSTATGLTAEQLASAFVAPGVPLPPLPAASPAPAGTPPSS
jgi:hypothetical protein